MDIWRLWEHRAHFDIIIGQLRNPPKHSRSVFLLCSFCCKSVSACLQEESRLRSTSANVNKVDNPQQTKPTTCDNPLEHFFFRCLRVPTAGSHCHAALSAYSTWAQRPPGHHHSPTSPAAAGKFDPSPSGSLGVRRVATAATPNTSRSGSNSTASVRSRHALASASPSIWRCHRTTWTCSRSDPGDYETEVNVLAMLG